ncbi:hypothetical protein Clacol_004151 [Clathrus columnatus]|uniref:Protein kinase domain-containing protein n=1 Tax=Clathrus columnatus TaxID=1419009 RepID=A0AAV5A8S5_9AGAM|nr:hypothetical protein Clacol_004151 [Clathrus columnatus]
MHSGSDYKTPPQSGSHVPDDIDNTPPNHGTACIAEYQINTASIDDIKEDATENLRNTEECEIETMLQAMLRIIAQKTHDSVENQKWAEVALEHCLEAARIFLNESNNRYTIQLRSAIKAYCDGIDGSEPNQETLPTELRVPEEELATIFKINDPRVLSYCKPDIIQLDWETARVLNGDDRPHDSFEDTVDCANSNYTPERKEHIKDNEKLKWDDILMTFELEKRKSLKDRDIPAEYQSGRFTHDNTKSMLRPSRSGLEVDLSNAPSLELVLTAQFNGFTPVRKTRSSTTTESSSPAPNSSSTTVMSSPKTAASSIVASSSSAKGSASTTAPLFIAETELSSKTPSSERRKRGSDQVASEQSDSRKARKMSKSLHPAVQSAIYAAERLSTGAWIKCAVGVVLVDSELYVVMHDRQSPLAARGFDFITNLPHFVVLTLIFQRISSPTSPFLASCHWDSIAFPPTPEIQFALEGHSGTIRIRNRSFQFKTGEVSILYVLNGRGTTGIPVIETSGLETETELPLFLKMSWPETVRQRESTIIQKIQELGKEHAVILDHTPNMLVFKTLTVHSTSIIRTLLGLHRTDRDCSRILHCAVFEKLSPLTDLKGLEFWKAYWDIVTTHHTLWDKGIEHCDISVSNLMYRMKDNVPKGVLNDFDLSRLSIGGKREGTRANDRTGTIPFMAIDLLSPPAEKGKVRHLYRHDLESFAWVLFWVVSSYDEGKEILRQPDLFENWHISASIAYKKKLAFFHFKLQPLSSWKLLKTAFDRIQEFWSKFYHDKTAARRLEEEEQDPDLVMVDEDHQRVQQGDQDTQQGMNGDELLRELVAFVARGYRGKKLPKDVLQRLPTGLLNSNDLLPL